MKSKHQSEAPVYCTRNDIMTALRTAFRAGRESPYELKGQEVRRVLKEVTEAKPCKSLKKYFCNAEEYVKVTGCICPICGSPEVENKLIYSLPSSTPRSQIICPICGLGQ